MCIGEVQVVLVKKKNTLFLNLEDLHLYHEDHIFIEPHYEKQIGVLIKNKILFLDQSEDLLLDQE